MELQVTQEYTGQQRHVCYLGPMWSEVLRFRPGGGRARVRRVAATPARGGGLVAVSNVGDDPFWTGHPLAQANLYAFGRLAWDPDADPRRDPRRVDRPDLRRRTADRRGCAAGCTR